MTVNLDKVGKSYTFYCTNIEDGTPFDMPVNPVSNLGCRSFLLKKPVIKNGEVVKGCLPGLDPKLRWKNIAYVTQGIPGKELASVDDITEEEIDEFISRMDRPGSIGNEDNDALYVVNRGLKKLIYKLTVREGGSLGWRTRREDGKVVHDLPNLEGFAHSHVQFSRWDIDTPEHGGSKETKELLESDINDYIRTFSGDDSVIGEWTILENFSRPSKLHYRLAIWGYDPYQFQVRVSAVLEDGSPLPDDYLNTPFGEAEQKAKYKLEIKLREDLRGINYCFDDDFDGEISTSFVSLLDEYLNLYTGGYDLPPRVYRTKSDLLSHPIENRENIPVWPVKTDGQMDVNDIDPYRHQSETNEEDSRGACFNRILKYSHAPFYKEETGEVNPKFYHGFAGSETDIVDDLQHNKDLGLMAKLLNAKTNYRGENPLDEASFSIGEYFSAELEIKEFTPDPELINGTPWNVTNSYLIFPAHPQFRKNSWFSNFDKAFKDPDSLYLNSSFTQLDPVLGPAKEDRIYSSMTPMEYLCKDDIVADDRSWYCRAVDIKVSKGREANQTLFDNLNSSKSFTIDRTGKARMYIQIPTFEWKLRQMVSYVALAMTKAGPPKINDIYIEDWKKYGIRNWWSNYDYGIVDIYTRTYLNRDIWLNDGMNCLSAMPIPSCSVSNNTVVFQGCDSELIYDKAKSEEIRSHYKGYGPTDKIHLIPKLDATCKFVSFWIGRGAVDGNVAASKAFLDAVDPEDYDNDSVQSMVYLRRCWPVDFVGDDTWMVSYDPKNKASSRRGWDANSFYVGLTPDDPRINDICPMWRHPDLHLNYEGCLGEKILAREFHDFKNE